MIVLLSQNYSITLISQDQRGFLLFLMVNQGRSGPSAYMSATSWLEEQPFQASPLATPWQAGFEERPLGT